MKKILSFIAATALVISAASCGEKTGKSPNTAKKKPAETTSQADTTDTTTSVSTTAKTTAKTIHANRFASGFRMSSDGRLTHTI